MKLTIYYDGQFYIGLVETVSENTLKAYRHVFGKEPKEQDILDFVNNELLFLMKSHEQKGVPIKENFKKKINPNRIQRQVSKELTQTSITSKAQEAIKKEYEQQKKTKKEKNKILEEEQRQYKRDLKIQKAKNKHKGK